jgi:hypothetical protein
MRSRALGRGGLLGLGALLGFLLAEAGVRVLVAPPQSATVARTEFSLPIHPEQGLYVATPAGRRLLPNARVTIENHALGKRRVVIETNALGYRNREIGPKAGTRILFLGDSITFADYLDEDETFVRLVESRARAEGLDWETVNAGVGAIGLQDELAILRETGLALQPDAVVLCLYLNDYAESLAVEVPALPGALRWSRVLGHLARSAARVSASASAARSALDQDLARWKAEFARAAPGAPGDPRQSRAALDRTILRAFDDWGASWRPEAWARMEPLLDQFQQLAAEHGFRPFVVLFPVRLQVEAAFLADEPQRHFARWAGRSGCAVLDLLPPLRELAQADATDAGPLFLDACHHTPRGSRAVADALFAFLGGELGAR